MFLERETHLDRLRIMENPYNKRMGKYKHKIWDSNFWTETPAASAAEHFQGSGPI